MANHTIPPLGPWLGAPGRSGGSRESTNVSMLKAIIMSSLTTSLLSSATPSLVLQRPKGKEICLVFALYRQIFS